MRPYSLLLFLLTALVSACNFGSYPSGGSQSPSGGGQQYPDDTYPGSPAPRPSYPDRPQAGQYPSRQPRQPQQYPSGQPQASSRAADPGVTVNNIRLTQDYTILDLTYTDSNQPRYDQNRQPIATGTIGFDQAGYLVAANGARRFNFVRVEGIPVKSEQIDRRTGKKTLVGRNTFGGERVNFTLYFERLDKGLENFDLFECVSDQFICWNIYNLYVSNPADVIVYNPPAPVPSPTRKPTTLPAPSGESGGETRSAPTPAPAPAPVTLQVAGVVSDAKRKTPVTATISYQLSASKRAVDSVQSFASTGAYQMTLLRGQVYTYVASARGYQSMSGVLDLSKTAAGQRITRDIALTPLAVGDKITLKNIYFEMSKSDLLAASYAELDQLVSMMTSNPAMNIRLEGHTDIIGDHAKNLQLSQDRVVACQRYLIQKGIDADRIQTIGYGDTRPITTKGTDEDRKINRRVEFVILTI